MIYHAVTDWSDAYSNGIHIANGSRWPEAWVEPAAAYRKKMTDEGRAELGLSYGDHERMRYDFFTPREPARGLMIFIHGGYWMSLDNSYWSHLAQGAVESGFAVAMPTYVLCPEVRIADITRQIAMAITAIAVRMDGPIHLAGHSAGGHLVSRMVSEGSPLAQDVADRIAVTVSISGVHDLRPLARTQMNETLHIDESEAMSESSVLLKPREGTRLACWVGGNERAEFLRQSALLANIWTGLGAETAFYADPDRHHFDVLDGLADPQHPLTKTLLGA